MKKVTQTRSYELARKMGQEFLAGNVRLSKLTQMLIKEPECIDFDYEGFAQGLLEVFGLKAEVLADYEEVCNSLLWYITDYHHAKAM